MQMKKMIGIALLTSSLGLGISACGNAGGDGGQSDSSVLTENQPEIETGDDSGNHIIYRDAETDQVISDANMQFSQDYTYLTGTRMGWSGGVIKWWYNPAGQPTSYTTQQVIDGLIASTKRWEAVCGVTFQYQGLTTTTPKLSGCDGASAVGWGVLTGSVVGQAQACYSGSSFTEMDLMLDNEAPLQISSLDMMAKVAVHEFGHVLGLGHTNITPAVMTAILSTGMPVQDDINGCQSIYGLPSTSLPQLCTPGATQACAVVNGKGSQTCSSDGRAWGSCQVVSCNTGYVLQNGACVAAPTSLVCQPNTTRSCSINNGTGMQTCNSTGSAWGTCQVTSCKTGYVVKNGRCRRR